MRHRANRTRITPRDPKRSILNLLSLGLGAMIGILILAASIGIVKGAQGDYDDKAKAAPTRIEEDDPRFDCKTMGNKKCGIPALSAAKKACKIAPKGSLQECLNLYMRGEWETPNTYTPAGPALVKECTDQYRGKELTDCFTQPIG